MADCTIWCHPRTTSDNPICAPRRACQAPGWWRLFEYPSNRPSAPHLSGVGLLFLFDTGLCLTQNARRPVLPRIAGE